MSLSTKSFATMVSDFAVAVQGRSSKLVDFTIGAVLRAVGEATAGVTLWLQGLILQLLAITRASTSSGTDLDSWFADYFFTRLPADAATGQATFSRITAGIQAVIPVGTAIQTADGTQQFLVILDTTNAAYSATLGGYVIATTAPSVSIPVQAVTAGAAGNVSANAANTLATAIAGVDAVTNPTAFANGSDAESDVAARARFIQYIASLSKATLAAIKYAIASVQSGVAYSVTENQQKNGTTDNGYFYAVVDDGSGAPGSVFMDAEFAAIDAARPIGIRWGVFPTIAISANVSMTLTTDSTYAHSAVVSLVVAAIQSYINALGIGATLSYTRLVQVAYDATPGVTNVSAVLLNSGTADLTATTQQSIKAGIITVA